MVIALFGDSCVGKSTLAEELSRQLSGEVYSGKDYLRLAKSEAAAEAMFRQKLEEAVAGEELILYVIAQPEQLALLPEGCLRVLVVASLPTVLQRFSKRTGGKLPQGVEAMLRRNYGRFEGQPWDLRLDMETLTTAEGCGQIRKELEKRI